MVATCGLTSFLEDFQPDAEAISALESSAGTVPFADAFAPMRAYAMAAFSMPGDLADAMVEELSRNFSRALFARFALTRDYRAFVRGLWTGGWIELFAAYPVLARLLEQTVARKIDEACELGARLEADLPALRAFFGEKFDAVVSIRSGMSDPHRGLRSVKILQFACGARLVYKPKDLALDAAWSDLLDWLRAHSPLAPLAPRVLNRGTHGWVEFIPHRPAADPAAIERYYRRAGALLAMLYAVRGADCHFENLIAHGEHPVLVDTETLMQPDFVISGHPVEASVLQAGLLPCRETAHGGEVVMSGGLDDAAHDSTATRPVWQDVNTDRMSFGTRCRIAFDSANVPELDGRPVPAGAYGEDVVAGFRETWRLLTTHRGELLAANGPMEQFRGLAARFVLRNTRVYCVLLRCATLPEFLRDEGAYRRRIESLLQKIGGAGLGPEEEIAEAEAAALADLDVPVFTTLTDSTSLFTDSCREITGVMQRCGFYAVRQQLRRMDEPELERQVAIIRDAFGAAPWVQRDWSRAMFMDEARRLGDVLLDSPADGADHSLWSGRSGTALFLAALHRVTGGPRYQHGSLAALRQTRAAIHTGDLAEAGIGGGVGIGSVVYALARAAEWLRDDSVMADAFQAARLVDAASIAADREFDVMSGAAGCILGLLAIGDTGRAALAAEHLAAHQEGQPEGGAAWRGRAPKPATGFAHGAAGIAYALWRMEQPRWRAAARLDINYERANFSASSGNWLDVRALVERDRPHYGGNSWCHGAPGIGLARLGILPAADDQQVAREIDIALDWVERSVPEPEHLCCGKFGAIELLLRAYQAYGREDLYARACRRAAAVVEAGRYDLSRRGLITGISGIGYELLRLAEPSQLPSVLLWE